MTIMIQTNAKTLEYRAFRVATRLDADKLRGLTTRHIIVLRDGEVYRPVMDHVMRDIIGPMVERGGMAQFYDADPFDGDECRRSTAPAR